MLLEKLRIPSPRSDTVPRHRLTGFLGDALRSRVTLVCAPAGYGKTTLLAEWVRELDVPAAWVSLDEDDNGPSGFWSLISAALGMALGSTDRSWFERLPAGEGDADALLLPLLNELHAVDRDLVLVLDDYHAIRDEGIQRAFARLLELAPARLHVVMSTRRMPNLPIARMSTRAELLEIGARELSFTSEEAHDFFGRVEGHPGLSAADVEAIRSKTEGWAAGMRLASLSLKRRGDPSAFAAELSGSNRRIADYLIDEVLAEQPPEVRDFMLRTSPFDRLCGGLCDAVLQRGHEHAQNVLEALERTNSFLVPLDDERRWYRYHHLFRGLLRSRLQEFHCDDIPVLLGRASVWFEQVGHYREAISTALDAGDDERATALVDMYRADFLECGDHDILLSLLNRFSPRLVRSNPILALSKAWSLVPTQRHYEAMECLTMAEAALAAFALEEGSESELRAVQGEILAARAEMAWSEFDADRLSAACDNALRVLGKEEYSRRSFLELHVGVAHLLSDDYSSARQSFSDVLQSLSTSPWARFLARYYTACISQRQGSIREAEDCLRVALRELESEVKDAPVAGLGYVALASLEYERDQLDEAARYLDMAEPLIDRFWIQATAREANILRGRIELARGRREQAVVHFSEAAEALSVYIPDPFMTQVPVPTLRLWFEIGYMKSVMQILDQLDIAQIIDQLVQAQADKSPSHPLAKKGHALARLLVARGEYERALRLLAPVLAMCERGRINRKLIEILVLTAVAMASLGDDAAALAPLARALPLAREEGLLRTFADEGPLMLRLLHKAKLRGISPTYVDQLIAACPKGDGRGPSVLTGDVLTARETEILRHAAAGLSVQEIADELVLSIHTVREHHKHIYSKLGVHTRLQAVQRAVELDVL